MKFPSPRLSRGCVVEITKEYLKQQIQELSQVAADTMAKFHRIQGALSYAETLLKDLETPVIEEEDIEVIEDES